MTGSKGTNSQHSRTAHAPGKPHPAKARAAKARAAKARAAKARAGKRRASFGAIVARVACAGILLGGCGAAYHSSSVEAGIYNGAQVRVVAITPQTTLAANQTRYVPREIPAVFSLTAGSGAQGARGAGLVPEAPALPALSGAAPVLRLPPPVTSGPYRLGVGDVVRVTWGDGTGVAGIIGATGAAQSLAAQYAVQSDGAVALPGVGRVRLVNMTADEAEAALFEQFIQHQANPSFSLEIAEFRARRVTVGGGVQAATVVPVTTQPLRLSEALARAGGLGSDPGDRASVRLYRGGAFYEIPLEDFANSSEIQGLTLVDGDALYVDTGTDPDRALAYFDARISQAETQQRARQAALAALSTEVALRRAALEEARANFTAQIGFDGVARDYVYLSGEVGQSGRFALPFGRSASLADALFEGAGGLPQETADIREIYVLRGSSDPREFGAVTAWHLDARNAANYLLATRFELRPDDVIFVAEQPVTRWGRVVKQITPSLLTAPLIAASN